MNPSIKKAIGSGFNAANKSFLCMILYVSLWVVATLLVFLVMIPTKPPVQSLANVFKNRSELAAPQANAAAAPGQEVKKREPTPEEKEIEQWFLRIWPVVMLMVLFLILAGIFLYGGQIGYLTKQIRGEPAKTSDFMTAASKSFIPLVGVYLLSFALIGAPLLVGGGLIALSAKIFPTAFSILLSAVFIVSVLVLFAWLGVRLVFSGLAVPADHIGPIESLKTSFRITKGRFWNVVLFSVVLNLISLAVDVSFRLLNWIGGFMGGALIFILAFLSIGIGIYLAFLKEAATIFYYDEAKPITTGSAV